ncbi:hypothetical protein [Allohahella marinimesophila]|uniref:Glycosyl transferase family 2 n=1 Tax=Allohahella marinimesophila TaxID=1054972 RepID=A0ABP7PM44_9GAMM
MFKTLRRQRRLRDTQAESLRLRQQILSAQLTLEAIKTRRSGVGNAKPHDIVVSLTTFDKRIGNVYLTIESLMQQSLKPDRIVLCVSEADVTESNLPEILHLQKSRGLEVLFCERDLGPYKKFFHTFQKYPDSLIITADDDLMYPFDFVDMLYRAWLARPDVIHAHRAHRMLCDATGGVLPYKSWEKSTDLAEPSALVFPTGNGGVLYFPGAFDEEVLNEQQFMALCPASDDIWLKAMSLKNGTLCQRIQDPREFGTRFVVIPESQTHALKRSNKSKVDGNDDKLKAVLDAYELWPRLTQRP